jgi:hypothetical protein
MFDLKTAKAQAREYAHLHGETYAIVETPANAQCNQHPFNLFNTGRYIPVATRELADYLAGGCKLVKRN